jgi:hypothetical protein
MYMNNQLQAPAALSPRYPLVSRLGGPQSRYGRGGEEKNSFSGLAGNRTLGVKPVVTILTEIIHI